MSLLPGGGSAGVTGIRMSELQRSVITCRGLHVDTLDRLPSTNLEMKRVQVIFSVFNVHSLVLRVGEQPGITA